jgi:glycosyltransferase 2 family protein
MLRFLSQQGDSVSLARRVFSLPTLVSLALAVAFLLFLVVRFDVDLSATWEQVKTSNPWYLALAVVVHYATFIFRGARWRLLLRNAQTKDQPVLGILYCSELILLGWFANSVAWFRLGDAYRAYVYQNEQGGSFSRTIGTIFSERVLDTILVVLLLTASAPFLVGQDAGASWVVMGTALALLVILTLGLLVISQSRQRLLRWLPGWVAERYRRFCEGALGSFRQVPLVTLLGLLGWLAEAGRLLPGDSGPGHRPWPCLNCFHHSCQLPADFGAYSGRSGRGRVRCRRIAGAAFCPGHQRGCCSGAGRPLHQLPKRHYLGRSPIPGLPGLPAA